VEVSDLIAQLFHAANVKQFVAEIRRTQEQYPDIDAFLEDAAAFLSPRLYERFYGESPPEALFGLCSASVARPLFSPEQSWRPAVQQAWLAAQERKREPWSLETLPVLAEGGLDQRWERFSAAAAAGDFPEAFGWARGFLQEGPSNPHYFRLQLLRYALGDTAFAGRKFVFLSLAWRLLQQVGMQQAERILLSPLHYLVVAPSDRSLCGCVSGASQPRPAERRTQAGKNDFARLEEQLLFGKDCQEATGAVSGLIASRTDPNLLFDFLLLTAAQAVSNAEAGGWTLPLQCFHLIYWTRELAYELPVEEAGKGLLLSTALLYECSRKSRQAESNRELEEVIRRFCPTAPLEILPRLISLGDPYAAATAAYAVEGMGGEQSERLFALLIRQAAKVDPSFGKGHDLLFAWEAADCYRRSTLSWKNRLPAAVAFLLARMRKKYELSAEYGV
jgi:hypothetical protein